MSARCRRDDVEALALGALTAGRVDEVRTHVRECAPCAHHLSWLQLERSWMAQRARRMPERKALAWEALASRLTPTPVPVRRRSWRPVLPMGLSAAAAVLLMASTLLVPLPGSEWTEGEETPGTPRIPACMDPWREVVSSLEAHVGACLVASPVLAQR
jgi:hypothetical protein